MKITFCVFRRSPYPNLGVGYLAAILKSKGHEIQHIELDESLSDLKQISVFKPDLIGLSFVSADFNKARKAIKAIRPTGIPILLGGSHINVHYDQIRGSGLWPLQGEGEMEIESLCEAALRKKPFEPKHGSYDDIDLIPFPDRDIFPKRHWETQVTSLLTSRGCPYHCSFCQVSAMCRKPRWHSASYVAQEMRILYDKYGIRTFGIIDDLFIAHKPRLYDLEKELTANKLYGNICLTANGRANLMTDELCQILYRLGIREVALGIESMSPRILSMLKDRVAVEQNINAIETLHRNNLRTGVLLMIGTPGETLEDMAITYDYIAANRHKVGGMQVCITTPLPKTKLWDECVKIGKIDPDESHINWDEFNIAAEDPRINKYVGDLDMETFRKVLAKFKLLMANKGFPETLLPL